MNWYKTAQYATSLQQQMDRMTIFYGIVGYSIHNSINLGLITLTANM